jgi:hypothetical protein
MGFFDPLFLSSLLGVCGLIGGMLLWNISYELLLPELIWTASVLALCLRDWSCFPFYVTDLRSKKSSYSNKWMTIVMIISSFAIAYGFYSYLSGNIGELRQSKSLITKAYQLSSSLAPIQILFLLWSSQTKPLNTTIRAVSSISTFSFLASLSKSSVYPLIAFFAQRWLSYNSRANKTRGLFKRTLNLKFSPVLVILITCIPLVSLIPFFIFYGNTNLSSSLLQLFHRLSLQYDSYMQIQSLSLGQLKELKSHLDLTTNIFGSLDKYSYNFAAHLHSIYTSKPVSSVGPNPRLLAYLYLALPDHYKAFYCVLTPVTLALLLSSIRNYFISRFSTRPLSAQLLFLCSTNLALSTMNDITSIKYSFSGLLLSCLILKLFPRIPSPVDSSNPKV